MRLIRSSLWNLLGGVVPAVAAFITVPLVVSQLGVVHYGLLTLITSIVGYFAMLDISASVGTLKLLAEYRARRDFERSNQLFTLGMALYLVIGVVGGASITFFAEQLTISVFNVPASLHDEAVGALRFGGVAFMFAQIANYLLSVPQAFQRYEISARTEVIFGTLTSVSTMLVVLLGGGLVEIMAARAMLSATNVLLLWRVVHYLMPVLRPAWPHRDVVRGLMSFSLYAYLSRIAMVSYANADKLLVGAYVDMRALALYAVPYLLANRVYSLTYRLGQVILPEASRLDAGGQIDQLRRTYLLSARYLMFLNASICCLLLLMGREVLYYWAGPTFGAEATLILALVSITVLVDSFTNLPSLVNDGRGKPANSGIFAIARSAVGLAAAWFAVRHYGVEGVAWSQLLVSLVMSGAFLGWVHVRVVPATLGEYLSNAFLPALPPLALALALVLFWPARAPLPLPWVLPVGASIVAVMLLYAWTVVLEPVHRARLLARMRRPRLAVPPVER